MSANGLGIGRCPADVDLHIAPDGPAQLLQPLQERPDAGLKFRIVCGYGQEDPNAPHPLGLLCVRRQRPPRHASAEQRDDLAAPHHSITSSASASSIGGTSTPSSSLARPLRGRYTGPASLDTQCPAVAAWQSERRATCIVRRQEKRPLI